ncbi:MAG: ATP-binding cassette domain-containing protein [Clostridia bacterium]|nr:ATP-binding cassette domain-containing protein [Clostridia bacterium]
MRETPVLEARSLCKTYKVSGENSLFAKTFSAVRDVSFAVYPGETFGVVGESGCGKSTVARLLMCLEKPTAGEVYFQGKRTDDLPEAQRRALRPRFQMVFQDSGSSLNPRKRVGDLIREPMQYHRLGSAKEIDARIEELLSFVGLPVEMKNRYPHEFSGGQRQRICIAKALSLNPDVIVLDEPVSALDVSVQAQILNLLRDLQEKLNLTYLFIGHGLGAVHYLSSRIAVMYRGRIVEMGGSDALFDHPAHPYTRALLDAAPVADYALRGRNRVSLSGEVDEEPPNRACPLYARCPYKAEDCLRFRGEMTAVPGDETHLSVCHRAWED